VRVTHGLVFFFFIFGFLSLMFKYDRVLYVLLAFEHLTLGVIFYMVSLTCNFFVLFFIFRSVISSIFIMIILVGLVKTYGSDLCYY
jgi:hypothetical protein